MDGSVGQQVFELKHILTASNIYLSSRIQINSKQIIALVSQDGDLVLHCITSEAEALPVLRRIPWFLEREKRITSLTFQPNGNWLLVTGWDGFLHIVPALALVDSKAICDQTWNPLDLSSFPSVTSSPPTCCVWWQSTALGHQMAFVGTDTGEIVLMNLSSGQRLGSRKVTGCLSALHVCHDNADSAYLLITCEDRQQWRVILEDRDGSWYWPEESGKSFTKISNREELSSLLPAPSTRSRLQGLKQMSVEKLASIRQRLAETRSKTVIPSLTPTSNVGSRRGSSSSDGSVRSSEAPFVSCNSIPQLENLTSALNAFLWPQSLRGRQTLSAHYAQSCFVTMLKLEDIEQRTPYGHKLSFPCRDVLVTERFLFVTDTSARRLSVISSKLSECRRHDELEHNPDSVVDSFEFHGDERILALYRVCNGGMVPVVSASGSSVTSCQGPPFKSLADTSLSQEEWIDKEITKVQGHPVDTCIIVTTHGVYHVTLKQCAIRRVLNHLLAGVDPDKASQLMSAELLTSMFGLDLQKLLELAGDLQLSKGNCMKAIELYKLARCRQMKWIVKLAAGGHSALLLLALQAGAMTSNSQEASPLERCQLANLAVLCQAQQLLSTQSKDLHEGFLHFLRTNQYYDEKMAVNIVGQSNLWVFLMELAHHRGLVPEALEVQAKMMNQALASDGSMLQKLLLTTQLGFWESVSDECLQEALFQSPHLLRVHSHFIESCIPHLEITILKRLAALYDPTNPTLRPVLHQFLRSKTTREGDLLSSTDGLSFDTYSTDSSEPSSPPGSLGAMENLLLTFISILMHITQMNNDVDYRADLTSSHVVPSPKKLERRTSGGMEVLSLVTCELSAGFSHAALVRNSGLFTWGLNTYGCLGVGPTMCRMSTPRPVLSFNALRIRVISVACGRTHTLALTENGLYSWGSSVYGQLGLGELGQSPYPRLVTSLLGNRIVNIAAGQYHSIALTSCGRVFAWGWGVHGQLGLGSIENRRVPCSVSLLKNQVVSAIAAGHAHSLFLLSSGQVLGCGSGIFGQLGTGTTNKSSTPTPVCNLPECIVLISTGYFHNLALSKSNRLYTWGSSPHMLRLQAQAQKRARLLVQDLQQHQQKETNQENSKTDNFVSPISSTEVQIISLKDSKLEDNSKHGVEGEFSNQPSCSTSKCTSPKVRNNVRLNGPQEILSDPLNATVIFPAESSCQTLLDPAEPLHPIPDLLVEAVPRESDGASSDVPLTPVSSNKITTSDATDKNPIPPVHSDLDASQLHLYPTLVDTSQVEGLIAEIACGCHHSALLTEEGRMYTWGRNMDGQLGHSGRKEAPIPTLVTELRAAQIACGAEFTLALHADGQVFGWGVNASAQVGLLPQKEPSKALEGKTIMLSTSKRVIKIPISVHNRVESPQEIPGIPLLCSMPSNSNAVLSSAPAATSLMELATAEEPPYGPLTLHLTLQQFHPHFNSSKVIEMCMEKGNVQAAARISLLINNIPASLEHNLNALISSWKRAKSKCADISSNSESQAVGEGQYVVKSVDQVSSSSTTLTDEGAEISQTDNSSENSEMHAFTVQGGNEEMSEGTDSDQTKSNHQPSCDETSSLASVSSEDQDAAAGSPSKHKTDNGFTSNHNDGKTDVPRTNEPGNQNNSPTDEWVESEIVRIIELYIHLIKEDEEALQEISDILEKIVSIWIRENLPHLLLERLIQHHWDEFSRSLAVLLFCSESLEYVKLAQSFSTSFMIKLCSSLCDYIQTGGESAQLNGLLTRLMAQKGLWGSSTTAPISIAQVLGLLNHDTTGGKALHVEPLHDSLDNNNIVAFSCGHRLTWNDYHAEVLTSRTDGSAAGAVLSDGEDGVFQHACPSCLAQYLRCIKL